MNIHSKWCDRAGNMLPNSRQADSENPSTFNAIVAIMHHQLYGADRLPKIEMLNRAKWSTNGGKYMTNNYDAKKYKDEYDQANWWTRRMMELNFKRSSDRFSHDETTGVVCSSYYFITHPDVNGEFDRSDFHRENISKIKDCSGQTWYRFYDVTPMIRFAKRPWRQNDRAKVISFALRACRSEGKEPDGSYSASGKIQAWLKLQALGKYNDIITGEQILPELKGWIEVFQNYFPEPDHPINVMARELYGN